MILYNMGDKMKITELLKKNAENFWHEKKPTIAFFGDSVTQGCFDIYTEADGRCETIYEPEYAYHRYIAKILGMLYPNVPVNIINAGLSGDNILHALERLERDVLSHCPDLTIVCFGLNDCARGDEGLELFYNSLVEIFTKLKEAGSEVIFMTPNMMNTSVSPHIKQEFVSSAEMAMNWQLGGDLERHLEMGKKAAKECDVRVCDVYSKWKTLYENGVNITELLANKINHPTHEMNWLFAYSLVEEMMK